MTLIRDMLFVKTLERQLGRQIRDEELNSEEPFRVVFPNGEITWIEIPVLQFPDDLLSQPDFVPEESGGLENAA
jgi:hypothetical protein